MNIREDTRQLQGAYKGKNLLRPSWDKVFYELSPELRLVLLCSNLATREINREQIERLISSEIDWPAFTKLVLRHRVYPVVYHYFRSLAHPAVPAEVMSFLCQLNKDNKCRTLQMMTEFLRILQSLNKSGITVIAIKGFPLAHQLYGDITLRTSRDLDILVHPEDINDARKIIESCGYSCRHTLGNTLPARVKKWMESNKHLEYWHPQLEVCVELHWRLDCQGMDIPLYQIENNLTSVELLGQSIKVLGKEELLLYLIIHGAAHVWFRLKWLLDIDLIIRKGGVSWEKLYSLADNLAVKEVLNQAFLLVRVLLATPLPEFVTDLAERDTRSQRLAALTLQLITDKDNYPNNSKSLGEKLRLLYRQKVYDFSLFGSRNKLSFVTSFFLPAVEDLELLSLSERLYFIYYAISPFTWFYRRTRNFMRSNLVAVFQPGKLSINKKTRETR